MRNLDRWHLALGSLVLLLLVALIYSTTTKEPTRVVLKFPGGGELKLEPERRGEIEYAVLLEEIYEKEFSKAGFLDWLAQKDIFFKDERFAEALNSKLCNQNHEKSLDEKMKRDRECAAQPIARRLRGLARKKGAPFHYVGHKVSVGVPKIKDQPDAGKASVCAESELFAGKIELTHPKTGRQVNVYASGRYNCTGYGTPDIQLNVADAKKLFPGSFAKHQKAIAVVLSPNPPLISVANLSSTSGAS